MAVPALKDIISLHKETSYEKDKNKIKSLPPFTAALLAEAGKNAVILTPPATTAEAFLTLPMKEKSSPLPLAKACSKRIFPIPLPPSATLRPTKGYRAKRSASPLRYGGAMNASLCWAARPHPTASAPMPSSHRGTWSFLTGTTINPPGREHCLKRERCRYTFPPAAMTAASSVPSLPPLWKKHTFGKKSGKSVPGSLKKASLPSGLPADMHL